MPPTAPLTASFAGLSVAALESRRRDDMIAEIERFGGRATVAAALREVPLEENREAIDFAERLLTGSVDALIVMTGAGARTLFEVAEARFGAKAVIEALGKIPVVARGPKARRALEEKNVGAFTVVPEPATWRETLKTMDSLGGLEGRRVAVQEQSEPNRLFLGELAERGAEVFPVPVYRTEMPADLAPLRALLDAVISGSVDVLLFTNAAQLENLISISRAEGKAHHLRRAVGRMAIGSVGPSCSEALRAHGFPVDIEPAQPSMEQLVRRAAEESAAVVAAKRSVSIDLGRSGRASVLHDPLHENLFMKACRREATPRTPIWLMRQAGRYMKEYRELRSKVSFLELCKNSDLASEVTVDAAHRLDVDAAIIFSDLLLIVEPLGFELSYGTDQGPAIANPFRSAADLKRVRPVDPEASMSFLFEAIRKTRAALRPDLPLIGFAGAPFTMASYMIEGKGSRNFLQTKRLMYGDPIAWHAFLEKITTATIDYLNAQIAAGAQAVQIFDSWVGTLSPEDYRSYALPHTRRLIQNIDPGVPVINFGTQTGGFLSLVKEAGGDVIGVDWRMELDEAWAALGDVAVMGNLDPVVLLSDPATIKTQARRILNQAGGRPGHIFNLGHGILPETPIENVLALIDAVKTESAR